MDRRLLLEFQVLLYPLNGRLFMATPAETYREGYEKGRKQGLAGHTGEAIFGMFKDDPGGHYAAGYHDGAGGRDFNPPTGEVRKPAAEMNPFDDKVAIKTVCPNCGALDWFEWKFLGKLTDPVCGHSWYVGSGTYTIRQIQAVFESAGKMAKYMTAGVPRQGAIVAKIAGWMTGVVFGFAVRLEGAVFMIPIQAAVGLCQPKKTSSEIVPRVVALALSLVGIGIAIYAIQQGTKPRMQPVQPTQAVVSVQPTHTTPPKSILGTWKADSELITFRPDGKYVDQSGGRSFSGQYSLSGSILVMNFPEIEMTAQVLSLNARALKYRKVKVVGFDGRPEPSDDKTYIMVRQKLARTK